MAIDRLAKDLGLDIPDYSPIASDINQRSEQYNVPATSDILGQAMSKYGVNRSILPAGLSSRNIASQKFVQERDQQKNLAQFQAQRNNYNQIYSYVMDRLANSNLDLRTQQQYARQLALDEMQRQFEASEAEKDRQAMITKQQIQIDYANKRAGQPMPIPNQDDEYKAALMRQMTGLASSGLMSLAMYKGDTPSTYNPNNTFKNQYQNAISKQSALQPLAGYQTVYPMTFNNETYRQFFPETSSYYNDAYRLRENRSQ